MTERSPKKLSGIAAVLSERELLDRIRSKEANAKRLFFERYAGYLTAVCSRYVPDPADTKDVLQDAFIKMFDALDGFEYRGEGSLKAWASRIVTNTALKSLRQKGRLSYVEDLPEVEEEEMPDVQQVPPKVIQGFIKALPTGYRTVFNLFVFEEKTHKEIAALLGIKEDSSASQYARARALLARQIKQYLKEHE